MSVDDLRLNGVEFCEISPTIERLKMEPGKNLIELTDSNFSREYNFSADRFLELVGTLRSLKVLNIQLGTTYGGGNGIALPLVDLLSRLPNLERLHLRGKLILEEAEGGPVLHFLTRPFFNLQFVEIEINKHDEKELCLLRCLLQKAPALEEVRLRPPPGGHGNNRSFFKMCRYLMKCCEQGTLSQQLYEINFRF